MAAPNLPFTPEVEARTAPIYDRLKDQIPSVEWQLFAPEIDAINRLKRERNAKTQRDAEQDGPRSQGEARAPLFQRRRVLR